MQAGVVAFHVAMFDRAAAAGFALGGKSDAAPDMANAKALIDKGLQGEDNMLAEVGSALALFVDRCFDHAGAGSGAQRRGRYVVLPMPVALATALTLPSCPKAVWTHALCHKSASPQLLLTGRHAKESCKARSGTRVV